MSADGSILHQGQRTSHVKRIINGSVVDFPTQRYPWYALPTSALGSNVWNGCGAAVISPTVAISSAHCFGGAPTPCSGPSAVAVWLGDVQIDIGMGIAPKPGGFYQTKIDADVVCHPDFDGYCSHGSDIVLLKFRWQVPMWVTPLELDLDATSEPASGTLTSVMGYGEHESPHNKSLVEDAHAPYMREVSLTLLDKTSTECSAVMAGGYGCDGTASLGAATNHDQQLCAGPKQNPWGDACRGDTGAPMLDPNGKGIAVLSYGGGPNTGVLTGPGRECGDPNYPRIYMKVAPFATFIREHLADIGTNSSNTSSTNASNSSAASGSSDSSNSTSSSNMSATSSTSGLQSDSGLGTGVSKAEGNTSAKGPASSTAGGTAKAAAAGSTCCLPLGLLLLIKLVTAD